MKSPITKTEESDLLAGFVVQYKKYYDAILQSGACDSAEYGEHDHRLAKWALLLAAEDFIPRAKESKRELANIRRFI